MEQTAEVRTVLAGLQQLPEIDRTFETDVRSARVVRLPLANHYVFFSNEADVLREMSAFLGSIPSQN